MTDKIFFQQPIQPVQPQKGPAVKQTPPSAPQGPSFQDLLRGVQSTVKFSQHAQKRMADRNITLTPQDLQKISSAVEKAGQKGAKDSLILLQDLAFVVSVKNKTVITAVDGESLKENVFTNIDSAVII